MALGFTHLTTAYDTTAVGDGGTYVTASHSVTAGKVVLACMLVAAGTSADTFTVSGHGTTWNLEENFLLATPSRRLYVWWGVPPSNSTGSITFTKGTGANTTGGGWSIVEVTDADTTTPIVQSVPAEAASGTTFAITLASPASADNRSFGFEFKGANELQAPDANHTELGEATGTAPNIGVQSQYSTSAFQTSVGWSTATDAGTWGGVALEIAGAAGSGTDYHEGVLVVSAAATVEGTDQLDANETLNVTASATLTGADQQDMKETGGTVTIVATVTGVDVMGSGTDYHEGELLIAVTCAVTGLDQLDANEDLIVNVAATVTGLEQKDMTESLVVTASATLTGVDQKDMHEVLVVAAAAVLSGTDQADFNNLQPDVNVMAILSGSDVHTSGSADPPLEDLDDWVRSHRDRIPSRTRIEEGIPARRQA